MDQSEVIAAAKSDLAIAAPKPYPLDFGISGVWQIRQQLNYEAIMKLEGVIETVGRAQSNISGFDHRELSKDHALQTIHFKLMQMAQDFPKFKLDSFPELCESELSVSESLISVNGRLLSSIYLTHLYFYLRTTGVGGYPKRILEIGTGYGGLARIYKTMCPGSTYVLVDLPESLFYAQVFLTSNFPEARVLYVHGEVPADIDSYDFVFVPAQLSGSLKGLDFDIVINTGSFQEMSAEGVMYWMKFIQKVIATKAFYSWNYFLNNKAEFLETQTGCSLICPILDPFWTVRYFCINNALVTIDCDQRNWLEVYVERIAPELHASMDLMYYSNNLVNVANSFRTATNYWFANIWMGVWVSGAPPLIEAMLFGIECFLKGEAFGIPNYLKTDEVDEGKFYKNILEQAQATCIESNINATL